MFLKFKTLGALLIMSISSVAFADIAIIGHPGDGVGQLDTGNVKKLFLGERKSFPSGLHATPINHVAGSPDRKEFFSSVLSMGESGYSRHWKRKISSGIGNSPEEVSSYEEILKSIANTPGAIGYIDSSKVNDSVKVLLIITDFNGV